MVSGHEWALGTTPGHEQVYARRTAERQAAFLLPHLAPGTSLLDCGCGPGTITIGLAEAVAPGTTVGIDHDSDNVRQARSLAYERGVANVTFQAADVLALPFEDATFDAAFENNLFIHLSDPVAAASEIRRVLKPGGIFAARDTHLSLIGNRSPAIDEIWRLFHEWQASRGSRTVGFGEELPRVLREAGFEGLLKSSSSDTSRDEADVLTEGTTVARFLLGKFGAWLIERGFANKARVDELVAVAQAWGAHPDSFHANVHVEVIGRKPG